MIAKSDPNGRPEWNRSGDMRAVYEDPRMAEVILDLEPVVRTKDSLPQTARATAPEVGLANHELESLRLQRQLATPRGPDCGA